ncbi:MAG TPA: alpha-amylase/4-alpha-glucanotransferase domain-containing protein [Methylomirabilota bacterium]|nr:alpha-amylase/4-alpha-glucanotransferase domain-containing protein [Methylomirabilota bacterium]
MSDAPLAFCFGVHNHQPIGNFESVLREATERAYRPFFQRLQARPELRLTVHCTGSLLAWLREHERSTFDLLGTVVASGRVELLTGGFYEPILAILPDGDQRGQIARLSEFLRAEFGVRPRGMWLAERVWEPHLPRALRDAGVEYVLVDDRHFVLAGLESDDLGGYYLTEDQGATLGVFPINQRLRQLIPFAGVDKSLEYLAERRGRLPAVTVVDDGEKFGVWPGTYRHVYEEGWLDTFFDRVLATPWLRLSTFADVVDGLPAAGRIYLPTASYQEMGEWALPPAAGRILGEARRDLGQLEGGARLIDLLRAGFWRNFLVKYPEVAEFYWKMQRLSAAVERRRRERPDDAGLLAAREALWRGQANDAYWHGVFGGCYLPHLRRAVKSALLEAEARLADGGEPVTVTRGDLNGDGREEIAVRTEALAVMLNPAQGGSLTEIGVLDRRHDLADVLARRPESYHAQLADAVEDGGIRSIHDAPGEKQPGLRRLLAYDRFRRASLLDGWFDAGGLLDAVEPWPAGRLALGDAGFVATVAHADGGVEIALRHRDQSPAALDVDKRVSVRGATLTARYRLAGAPGSRLDGRWAVQWNLALSAGEASGRYLTLPGRPSLASSGRLGDVSAVTLVDEWLGLEARLAWTPGAELAWGPVETVSVSEAGFERIYQGLAVLLAWPLDGETGELSVALTAGAR